MNKLKNKLLAHKIVIGISLMLIVGVVGVVAAAYTSQNEAPNAVFEGDCINCDLSKDAKIDNLEQGLSGASPYHYNHQRFLGNFTKGGGSYMATSSTASAFTLTTKELGKDKEISYIEWTAGSNITLTTMASTSAPFSSMSIGEEYYVSVYAAGAGDKTITYTAGTGIDLQEDEGETVVQNGLEIARLTFLKKANTDILMWTEIGQVGD